MRLLDRAGALDESIRRRNIGIKMQKTILLVEDNEKYAEVIKLHLERGGHKIQVVYDGETALQKVGEVDPDIIFLDVMLPGMDGIAVCEKLKSDPDLKTIPVVMLTGRTHMKDVNSALSAGAEDYITKMSDIEAIWAQIDEKIERFT